jgi:NAD(P)-dependent dehydrogenase (short-subunit alcohol dehydrogenase family)
MVEDLGSKRKRQVVSRVKLKQLMFAGVYLTKRAFMPLMLKGGAKTIIDVSSIGAHLHTNGASAYQATKLAVCRLAEFVNVEYGDQGLLAYSIHPGGGM